ncbi:hypothetical protein [Oceanimonas smirnovii]|uniref:hypothetical protein n=1 Tax=Oceanimonas smirnovii TaxID=264574 RepID=UPI0003698413|nr:hypothetical protein [Oceanimonas smirnovii]
MNDFIKLISEIKENECIPESVKKAISYSISFSQAAINPVELFSKIKITAEDKYILSLFLIDEAFGGDTARYWNFIKDCNIINPDFESSRRIYSITKSLIKGTILHKKIKSSYISEVLIYIQKHLNSTIKNKPLVRQFNLSNKKHLSITIVASILSPHRTGAHLGVVYNIIKGLISSHQKDVIVNLALTGEGTVKTSFGNISFLDNKKITSHKIKWKNEGGNGELYIGCSELYDNKFDSFIDFAERVETDVMLFLGDIFESKLFRRLTYDYFPVAYTYGTSTNDPKGFVDSIISRGSVSFLERVQADYKARCLVDVVPAFMQTPLPFKEYVGQPLDDDFFWIFTPLQSNRLEVSFSNLSNTERNFILKTIIQNNIAWAFAGEVNRDNLFNIWPELKELENLKRLRFLGYIDSLRGLKDQVKITFMPPNVAGGAGGVQALITEGVPAIIPIISDATSTVPESGVYSTVEECVLKLELSINSMDFYATLKSDIENKKKNNSFESVGDAWFLSLLKASSFGKSRLMRV